MISRYFQWLVGESFGKVTELIDITEEDGEYFYNFTDGESCNLAYISPITRDVNSLRKYAMVEVSGPNNAWTFKEIKMGKFETANHEMIDVPPLEDIVGGTGTGQVLDVNSVLGTKKAIPPQQKLFIGRPLPDVETYLRKSEIKPVSSPVSHSKIKEDESFNKLDKDDISTEKTQPGFYEIEDSEPPVIKSRQAEPKDEISDKDPVAILVKTCKKHPTVCPVEITVDLPGTSVFTIAKTEFENGDKKFIDCIVKEIDTTSIISAIKDALLKSYAGEE